MIISIISFKKLRASFTFGILARYSPNFNKSVIASETYKKKKIKKKNNKRKKELIEHNHFFKKKKVLCFSYHSFYWV